MAQCIGATGGGVSKPIVPQLLRAREDGQVAAKHLHALEENLRLISNALFGEEPSVGGETATGRDPQRPMGSLEEMHQILHQVAMRTRRVEQLSESVRSRLLGQDEGTEEDDMEGPAPDSSNRLYLPEDVPAVDP